MEQESIGLDMDGEPMYTQWTVKQLKDWVSQQTDDEALVHVKALYAVYGQWGHLHNVKAKARIAEEAVA